MEATNLVDREPVLYNLFQVDSNGAEAARALIKRSRPDARTLADFSCGIARDLEIIAERFQDRSTARRPPHRRHSSADPRSSGHGRRRDHRWDPGQSARMRRRYQHLTAASSGTRPTRSADSSWTCRISSLQRADPGNCSPSCSPETTWPGRHGCPGRRHGDHEDRVVRDRDRSQAPTLTSRNSDSSSRPFVMTVSVACGFASGGAGCRRSDLGGCRGVEPTPQGAPVLRLIRVETRIPGVPESYGV